MIYRLPGYKHIVMKNEIKGIYQRERKLKEVIIHLVI